ncbi:amino acid ABC transporter permease [Clostridium sp. DL1XJH146]
MDYLINITLFILEGSKITVKLYIITMLFSIPVGMLGAIGKTSKLKYVKVLLEGYTSIIRGTPLLLQLFFVYYGLPVIGIRIGQFSAASLTFIINYGAYFTEIFRAGIQSIDKGQYEAAKALGMDSKQTMRKIILPQAIKRVIPPTSNEAITLVKDTALVAAIGMGDILRGAKEVLTRDFNILPFVIAAIIYLIFTFLIVKIFKKIESKYSVYE